MLCVDVGVLMMCECDEDDVTWMCVCGLDCDCVVMLMCE